MPKTIQDLIEIGWEKFTTDKNRVFYVRPGPDKKRVNQRRDLTPSERTEIGDILFPGRQITKIPGAPDPPTPSTSRPSDVFVVDSTEEGVNEVPEA